MATITKYKLTLDAGKSLKVETIITGDTSTSMETRILPVGKYKVKKAENSILILDGMQQELSVPYNLFADAGGTQLFSTADEALAWFVDNFFVEAPGEGGGGTDSFDSQSFTATSSQTDFTTTFDLPSDSKRVKVLVESNGVIVGLPFTKSGNKITVSERLSGEKITVEKI